MNIFENSNNKIFYFGALIAAFFIPIKLSFTYITLLPLLILWLWSRKTYLYKIFKDYPSSLSIPIIFWIISALVSSLFGIDQWASLFNISRFALTFLSIWFFFDISKHHKQLYQHKILMALLSGQSIAALSTIVSPYLPIELRSFFPGAVTESGQLALTLVIACGLTLSLFMSKPELRVPIYIPFIVVINITLMSFLGFVSSQNRGVQSLSLLILILAGIFICLRFTLEQQGVQNKCFAFLFTIVIPLLGAALLINLKRGPWLGICVAALIFLARYHRRMVLPALTVIALTIFTINPIKQRIIDSADDFFISGGRSNMWQIGAELSVKYPLGIGFSNSSILKNFDPNIPDVHNHFHNNFLNILVETGWIGLLLFLWWIKKIISTGLKINTSHPNYLLAFTISLSFISWQVAGLVEYNFGDSEVLLVVYLLLGVLGALISDSQKNKEHPG